MAGWKDTIQDAPKSSWKDSIEDETTELESGARGLAQGATMGFADEATGVVEALWNVAKGDPKTFGELYKQSRDESRANYEKAEKTNPTSYMAGQVGGAVGTSFIPGAGGASLAKLAGMGALQGLGESEAELAEGDVSGLVKDAAIGGAIGGASFGAGKALEKGIKVAGQGLSKVGDLAADGIESGSRNLLTKLGGIDADMAKTLTSNFGDDAMTSVRKAATSGDANVIENAVVKSLDNYGLATKVTPDKITQGSKEIAESFSNKSNIDPLKELGSAAGLEFVVPGLGQVYGAAKVGQAALKAASNPNTVLKGMTGAEGVAKWGTEQLAKYAPRMGKYGKILQSAAQRGGQSLAATDFILSQQDPEYRRVKNSLKEDDNSDESQE